MAGFVKKFYDTIAELKIEFPEKTEKLDELKEIYDKTRDVIANIVANISKIVHSNYTPELFNLEDFNKWRKIEGIKPPEGWSNTLVV